MGFDHFFFVFGYFCSDEVMALFNVPFAQPGNSFLSKVLKI